MALRPRLVVPTLIVCAAAACASPAPEPSAPPPPPAITQASVEQAVQDATAALASGDGAKAAASYAPDAVFVSARGKVESQAGIEAFWTEALKAGAGKDLKLETLKWGTSGDMAYTLSRFTGGITATSGHVLAVSVRQPDGTLKTVVQVSLPDPPAK
jgi:uncharacterized protein (TIGR02246 family)